mgnify:CR=1 FL=1
MKKAKILLLSCTFLLFTTGCSIQKNTQSDTQLYEKNFIYFDTVIGLQFYAGANGQELMDHCVEMCGNYENTFSRTLETSELYAINHRTENTVTVSDDVARLISVGLEYYQISNGKFDITVAPLSDLWDFKSEDATVPDADDIANALKKVGADQISLSGNTLTFTSDDVMIDLGALVKGFAADQLKAYLTENGVTSGLLNLGGNVLTIGSRPDGSDWSIGIQKPFDDNKPIADVIKVKDQTVVSSGIYERYFRQDGVIYHHILDPDTGYPIQNDLWGVSVICDSSLTGDALSTTCMTLGYKKADSLIQSLDHTEAEFILEDCKLKKTF